MPPKVRAGLDRTTAGLTKWWISMTRAGRGSKAVIVPAIVTCFVALAGTWMTDRYQTTAWVRERHFEIFKQNFEGGLALVDDLSEHLGTRFIGLKRVMWAASEANPQRNLEDVWTEYYNSVVGWNAKLLRYKGQLTRFIGPDAAETFCSRDDYRLSHGQGDPQSIHGLFFITQDKVRKVLDCVQRKCQAEAQQAALRDANQSVDLLGVVIEDFINTATQKVYERAEQSRGSQQNT